MIKGIKFTFNAEKKSCKPQYESNDLKIAVVFNCQVKVAMQTGTASQFRGPLDAAKQIVTSQGPLALYRGMASPLAMVAAFNALLFSTSGALNRIIRPDGGPLTAAEAALSGFFAGVPVSILGTPTELLKCRLQKQGAVKPPPGYKPSMEDIRAGRVLFKGPRDALAHTLKHEGGVRGMFKGLVPTLWRECPGNAAYFGAYALTKQTLAKAQGLDSPEKLGPGSLIAAGGVAGPAFWGLVYPIDNIKSRIQVDNYHQPKYSGMMDCARQVLRTEGWAGLWRGWEPCIARSVPANAVTFLVYEYTRNALTKTVEN